MTMFKYNDELVAQPISENNVNLNNITMVEKESGHPAVEFPPNAWNGVLNMVSATVRSTK